MSKRNLIIKHDCYTALSVGMSYLEAGHGFKGLGIYKKLLDYMAINGTDSISIHDIGIYATMYLCISEESLKEFLDFCSVNPDDGLFTFNGQSYTSLVLQEQLAEIKRIKNVRADAARERWKKEKKSEDESCQPIKVKGLFYITTEKEGKL
jgi:hypothetical protein